MLQAPKSCSKVAEHNREKTSLGSGMPTRLCPTNDLNDSLTVQPHFITHHRKEGPSEVAVVTDRIHSAFKLLLSTCKFSTLSS